MSKTKHQLRSEETYHRFIEAMTEMINEDDIDKITIRDICSKIGLSPRSFYLYFDSKEHAILKCYYYLNASEFNNQFSKELLPEQPYERLLAIFLRHHQIIIESPKLARAIYICELKLYDKSFSSDELNFFKLVLDAVEQCQKSNILTNSVPARDIAWDLIFFSRGTQMNYLMSGESIDLPKIGMQKLKAYLTIYAV